MSKNIEVEFIGPITEIRLAELKEFLEKNGKYIGTRERLSFMYFRDKIPLDIEEIKNEKIDLRLRITNKNAELVLKYGLFDFVNVRKELSIKFDTNDFEKYIDMLHYLGWDTGVVYATKVFLYLYKGAEISLVNIIDYGYNFEIEIISEERDIETAKKQISVIMKELSLITFNKQQLRKQCNEINNNKNLRFDFKRQNFDELYRKFKEFF